MDSSHYNYYKHCIVPQCKSTSVKTPNKLFIYVPNNKKVRQKWLELAGRNDAHSLSTDTRMYFCEDHFDLPSDMVNHMEYKIMGKVSQVRMKQGCMPSKFECQEDRIKRTCSSIEQPSMLKKQRLMTLTESLNIESEFNECPSSSLSVRYTSDRSSNSQVNENEPNKSCGRTADKSIQVYITHKFRSKAVQTKVLYKDQTLSPFKALQVSSSTSPFKAETILKSMPSVSGQRKINKKIFIEEEHSDSDISVYMPSSSTISGSPSSLSLQVKSSSNCSEFIEEDKKILAKQTLINMIAKIEKKPRLYIGVPNSCYYLINLIKDELKIPKHYLLVCLEKIRLDTKFNQLSDDFGMSPSLLSKIFLKNIPLIASVMQPFIVTLDSKLIKKTLPMPFRHKYHNVSCIIDCLEIEIQKPSKAINQALTWSDYKKANTIKYLISCTPNGLINYISPGFGGRTTDTCLVESCDFIQGLKSGMCVMADRGFKHVEQYLQKYGVTLVRPPSVQTGEKLSKSEAKLTKQIASLRIHVERVIRRLREFYMLRPHSCINLKFLKILDDILIIACALVNLQDSLIQ